jgi:hypothetical protein
MMGNDQRPRGRVESTFGIQDAHSTATRRYFGGGQ